MITNCNTCGKAYEVPTMEEADNPNRKCDACFYKEDDYRIDNVYWEEGQTGNAFLMFTGVGHRRMGLAFGLPECIGGIEYDRQAGGWAVSINVPYDSETDSDSEEIGIYPARDIALRVLWANRHRADWG